MDSTTPTTAAATTATATGTAATTTTAGTTTSVVVDLSYGENDNIKCPPMVTGTVYQARVPTVAATRAAAKLCQQKAQHQQRHLFPNTNTNKKTSGSGSFSGSSSESDDEEDNDSEESDSDEEEEGCSAVNDRDVCLDLLSTIETNLKQQVADILFQNPWLASTLRSNPQYTLKDTVRTKNSKYGLQALKNSGILMSGTSDHSSNSNSNSNSNSKHHHKSKYQLEYPTALTRDECHRYADKVVRVITTVSAGGGGNRHCPTASVPCADKTIAAMDLILADPITENTYKELVDAVRPFLPKNTESSVVAKGTTTANDSTDDGGTTTSPSNEMTMLWDILLIPLTDSKTSFWNCKFLMVHSLDRAVADTTTYYNIYAMLSTTGTTTIQSLDPTRHTDVEQIKRDLLEDVDPNFLRSPAVQAGCAKRLVQVGTDQMKNSTVVANMMASSQKLSSSILKKTVSSPSEERSGNSDNDAANSSSSTTTTPVIPTNQTSVWFCDETKIKTIQKDYRNQLQQQEQQGEGEVERNADTSASTVRSTSSTGISANDIIASWFLRQNKDAPIGCIVTDIRSRHPDLPQNLAGNYEAEVIYNTPLDVQHPAMIQASLNRPDGLLKRCGATHNSGSSTDEHALPDAKTLSGGLFSKYAPGNTRVLNWSSAYKTVVLKQSDTIQLVPECHIPIYLQHQSGIHNSIGWNTLIIFRWSEEKLGLLIMAPPSATDDDEDPENEAPIIRPQIMSPP